MCHLLSLASYSLVRLAPTSPYFLTTIMAEFQVSSDNYLNSISIRSIDVLVAKILVIFALPSAETLALASSL